MIDYLGKFSCKNNNENMEKVELTNLRKEVARLKKKVKINIKKYSMKKSKKKS
jgi:hypothetical protein